MYAKYYQHLRFTWSVMESRLIVILFSPISFHAPMPLLSLARSKSNDDNRNGLFQKPGCVLVPRDFHTHQSLCEKLKPMPKRQVLSKQLHFTMWVVPYLDGLFKTFVIFHRMRKVRNGVRPQKTWNFYSKNPWETISEFKNPLANCL